MLKWWPTETRTRFYCMCCGRKPEPGRSRCSSRQVLRREACRECSFRGRRTRGNLGHWMAAEYAWKTVRLIASWGYAPDELRTVVLAFYFLGKYGLTVSASNLYPSLLK